MPDDPQGCRQKAACSRAASPGLEAAPQGIPGQTPHPGDDVDTRPAQAVADVALQREQHGAFAQPVGKGRFKLQGTAFDRIKRPYPAGYGGDPPGLGPRILCNTHPVGIHVAFGHPRTACGFAYPLETPHQKQPRAQDDDTQGLAEALGPHKGHHPGQEDHGQHPAVCDEEGVDIGGPAQDGFLPIRRQRHEIPHGTAQQQKEGKDDPQAAHPYRDMPGLRRGDAWGGEQSEHPRQDQTDSQADNHTRPIGGVEEAKPHVSGGQPLSGSQHERDDAVDQHERQEARAGIDNAYAHVGFRAHPAAAAPRIGIVIGQQGNHFQQEKPPLRGPEKDEIMDQHGRGPRVYHAHGEPDAYAAEPAENHGQEQEKVRMALQPLQDLRCAVPVGSPLHPYQIDPPAHGELGHEDV